MSGSSYLYCILKPCKPGTRVKFKVIFLIHFSCGTFIPGRAHKQHECRQLTMLIIIVDINLKFTLLGLNCKYLVHTALSPRIADWRVTICDGSTVHRMDIFSQIRKWQKQTRDILADKNYLIAKDVSRDNKFYYWVPSFNAFNIRQSLDSSNSDIILWYHY